MMKKLNVGLFNDSFPPTIDGVASVTKNYAEVIERYFGHAVVATPYYPGVKDFYPFEVVRYPSAYIRKLKGHRAGYPFDLVVLSQLQDFKLDIIHSHCPIISTVLARVMRKIIKSPIVFTYHTKFDIDIEKLTASDSLRKISIKFLINNINACDEVWVVSEGAGENLRSIGYEGDYIVMENGTDFERCRASASDVDALRKKHAIDDDTMVFLFVGRMMWYKGVKLSLDGLKIAKQQGEKFKYILIGDGIDRSSIEKYIKQNELTDDCILTGELHDRELIRAYFTLADLFLFPSTFDTNGIVVREAAACFCPSLLIKGSCAAEGIVNEDTGIIIEETVEAMSEQIIRACRDRERLKKIGENAAGKIYISWKDAVEKAYERYLVIIENFKNKNESDDEETLADSFNIAYEQVAEGISTSKWQWWRLFRSRRKSKFSSMFQKTKEPNLRIMVEDKKTDC